MFDSTLEYTILFRIGLAIPTKCTIGYNREVGLYRRGVSNNEDVFGVFTLNFACLGGQHTQVLGGREKHKTWGWGTLFVAISVP